jgi:hypothetical protein
MSNTAATRCTEPARPCDHCGQPYVPTKDGQRFCRSLCRSRDWDQRNPRVKVDGRFQRVHVGVKLETRPTVEQLEAAGIRIRGKR